MECKKCGTHYEDDATYCNICDISLVDEIGDSLEVEEKIGVNPIIKESSSKLRINYRISRLQYLARLTWGLMIFWLIYGGGAVINAGVVSEINWSDFSAFSNSDNWNLKFFIPALVILVITILIATSQRLLDLGLGNIALLIVIALMTNPVISPVIVFLLGTVPSLVGAKKFGASAKPNSYFIILSAICSPFFIYITWELARIIKSSPIPM